MLSCPRCHQSVKSEAVACPHCGTVLKAYGHPGITLHRAIGKTPLCETCTYQADDTCTFPQRPYAKECTLYDDINESRLEQTPLYVPRRRLLQSLRFWCQRNPVWLGLLVLVFVSVLLALYKTSR